MKKISVSIDVCKDVEKYKENVFAGFDIRQVITILIALIMGVLSLAVLVFVFHLPPFAASYLMMPVVAPVIAIGFSNKDGMNVVERMSKKKNLKSLVLYNISTETYDNFIKYSDEYLKNETDKEKTHEVIDEEQNRKIMIMAYSAVGAFCLLIIGIIIALVVIFK